MRAIKGCYKHTNTNTKHKYDNDKRLDFLLRKSDDKGGDRLVNVLHKTIQGVMTRIRL